jgi:hypothetical protein
MIFTGTLIEDLMATVERAEQRTLASGWTGETTVRPLLDMDAEAALVECWFASAQPNALQNSDCDSKLLGVAS